MANQNPNKIGALRSAPLLIILKKFQNFNH